MYKTGIIELAGWWHTYENERKCLSICDVEVAEYTMLPHLLQIIPKPDTLTALLAKLDRLSLVNFKQSLTLTQWVKTMVVWWELK